MGQLGFPPQKILIGTHALKLPKRCNTNTPSNQMFLQSESPQIQNLELLEIVGYPDLSGFPLMKSKDNPDLLSY